MNINIIYEDDDMVVVDKPAGVVVNRAKSAPGETIQDWMDNRYQITDSATTGQWEQDRWWWQMVPETFDASYGEPVPIFIERTGMVHRIDKDTSGVLILAKNPGAILNLMSQFQQRLVKKTYTCLVHGLFSQDTDLIRLPMARSQFNRQRFSVTVEGRPAETEFVVKGRYSFNSDRFMKKVIDEVGESRARELKQKVALYDGFTLVECHPLTGRTHQIRVHMAHLQHPLVGDKLYLGKKRIKVDELWCSRQFLHASRVELLHLRTHEPMILEAPLPEDLQQALVYMEPIS